MVKILLSAFEAFDNSEINATQVLLSHLQGSQFADASIEKIILPVDRYQAPALMLSTLHKFQPHIYIACGQASGRAVISVEKVALNLLDYRIPDNSGNIAQDLPIEPDAPAAYFSTLPVREIHNALVAAEIPAEISLNTGAYLCNQIFYQAQHAINNNNLPTCMGFVHFPALPSQASQMKTPCPSMSLDVTLQALEIIIKTTLITVQH